MVELKPTVVNGVEWFPFAVEFKSSDGVFQVIIYAVSFEHASYLLEELKQSGEIVGQITDVEA